MPLFFIVFCLKLGVLYYLCSVQTKKYIDNSERQLINLLRQGSQWAFDVLYNKYSKELYVYSLQLTKSAEKAEEIVHDVFVRLWVNRDKLKDVDTLHPLLFQMSKNQLVNAFRARVNSPVFEEYVEQRDYRRADSHSPLEYEEFVKQLKRCLEKLPSQQRIIVSKSKLDDKSPVEIAKELGISVQTVRNQLSQGLKQIRWLLSNIMMYFVLLFIK